MHKDIKATALVPNFHASTQAVRRVLPSHVTHGDATFNASRTAVQVVALDDVLVERDVRIVLYGDAVVIPEYDQVAELLRPRGPDARRPVRTQRRPSCP